MYGIMPDTFSISVQMSLKMRFIDSVDEDEIIYKDKNTKIIYKGELVDYPFQTNIHQLEKSEFIDCLYDLFP